MTWRTGRKVGRTIYRQLGDEPSDNDELIGVMDTAELAAMVVGAVNGTRAPEVEHLVRAARAWADPAGWLRDPAGRRFGNLERAVRALS